jgi:hypothetical protein
VLRGNILIKKAVSFTKCSPILALLSFANPEVLIARYKCEQENVYVFIHGPDGINKLVRLKYFKVKFIICQEPGKI